MTSNPTVQNVQLALPIVALAKPPEGQAAVDATLNFTPTNFAYSIVNSLKTQLFDLSQVITLVIDNSANPNPITVTHGAFAQVVKVPANTGVIIPTFSSAFVYPLAIAFPNGAPAANCSVGVTYLNYDRTQYGDYTSDLMQQTVTQLAAMVAQLTTNNANLQTLLKLNQNQVVYSGAYTFAGGEAGPIDVSIPTDTFGNGAFVISVKVTANNINPNVNGTLTVKIGNTVGGNQYTTYTLPMSLGVPFTGTIGSTVGIALALAAGPLHMTLTYPAGGFAAAGVITATITVSIAPPP